MRLAFGLRARRRAQVEWVSLAAAAVVLAGCASPAIGPAAGPDVRTVVAAAAGDRLTATVTYNSGQERFDPPPADYHPKVTAGQAFAEFARQDDPRSLGTDEKPTVLLASYTNFITGQHATFVTGTMDPVAAAKSDGASKPWWTDVPVWYIRYLRVPVVPVGPPHAPGRTAAAVVEEMVIPVSADTGKVLMWENTVADRTPTSWPPSPGNGDTRKTSQTSGG